MLRVLTLSSGHPAFSRGEEEGLQIIFILNMFRMCALLMIRMCIEKQNQLEANIWCTAKGMVHMK